MAARSRSVPGRTLVLVGADGAGKSTQAKLLRARLGSSAVYMYMGSNPAAITHALPTTRAWTWLKARLGGKVHHSGPPDPGQRPRPSSPAARLLQHLKSLGVVALRSSDEVYRLLLARSHARRGYIVIMDRHPYPDYYMRRVRATAEWRRLGDRIHGFLLERLYPRPGTLVLLDAPAEVLHARKPEGSLEAVRARRREYQDLTRALHDLDVTVVDVRRSEEDILADLMRIALGDGGLDATSADGATRATGATSEEVARA